MNEALMLPEEEEMENEEKSQELRAREIAEAGDYFKIIEALSEEGLLEAQVKRVRGAVDGEVDFLNQRDWEMLTVLELFDLVTFEHSLNTHKIAKDKIERVLDDELVIADFIQNEVMDLNRFYRACLLHDIGKVKIPKPVLNKVFHEDWDLPVADVLDETDIENVKDMGFDIGSSSNEIMKHHEKFSERILAEAGLEIEAVLAGQHHNYEGKSSEELKMPLSSSALCISLNLADIVHLADVQQALEQERPYKQKAAKISVLAVLVSHAKQGLVDKYITYLWVKDELKTLTDKEMEGQDVKEDLGTVISFLDSHDQI